MKYAFNGFLFSQRQTGVMRYAKEILCGIDRICAKNEFVLIVPEYADSVPYLSNIGVIRYGHTKNILWEQLDFAKYLRSHRLHGVNFSNTMPLFQPGIIVIHDIVYKTHPEFANSIHGKLSNFYHRIMFYKASKSTSPIITVSEFSKKQIVQVYSVNPNRIHVIGNAWQHTERYIADNSILEEYALKPKSFYYSLSSLSIMKNTKWLLEVAKKNPSKQFVISGAKAKCISEDYVSLPNVLFTGYISDEQVKSLIENCRAFIYPSLYDGFGIPPLEALSLGAKVICSNTACLPEIYKSSVSYIDPYNTNVDLDSLVDEKTDDPEVVLDRFSWEKSAYKFYKVLKDA